ncbi:tetratricopeptide repeat protein [Lentzea sp. NPDC004782]|uniref:tetratricopeptide repeat protein n=1 Tax=Lentzea sp. NPDC004782 TaxID=3154458 RepID=UPI00339E8454
MAELSNFAGKILRTITSMPGTSDVVHVDLIHAVVGDPVQGSDVVDELVRAGHAIEVDPCHYRLTTVMQPAADDDPLGYDAFILWHTIRATMADKITQPFSWRLSPVYEQPGQLYESAEHAMSWFREHRRLLVAMLNAAFERGWYDLSWKLAEPLWSLCRFAGEHEDELATQLLSLRAVDHLQDDQQALRRAVFHARSAFALSSLRRHDEALPEAERAIELARRIDTPQLLSTVLSVHGRALQFAGSPRAALERYEEALVLAEETEDTRSIALRYRRVGEVLIQLDDVVAATEHFRAAAELMTAVGDAVGRARVLTFLGRAQLAENEHVRGAATVLPVLEVLEKSGCALYAADALELLGEASEALHEPAARVYYIRAIEAFQGAGEAIRAERVRGRLAGLGNV